MMSVKNVNNYEDFKASILKVYELRQKAYRLLVKDARKSPTHTCLDSARYSKETFEKWLLSKDVNSFKGLKEVMLIDHFTNLSGKELSIKSREKIFKSVKDAKTLSDDRTLVLLLLRSKQASATCYTLGKSVSRAALPVR